MQDQGRRERAGRLGPENPRAEADDGPGEGPKPGDFLVVESPLGAHGDLEVGAGFAEGRPLLARNEDSRFGLANLMRAISFASLCALRTGLDILTDEEGVVIDGIHGHGGFFKSGLTSQRMMAAALDVPVSVSATAGEGGAWGMAVLAAYMLRPDATTSLADFLDERIGGSLGRPVLPDPTDAAGFAEFYARHQRGLAIERAAIEALP